MKWYILHMSGVMCYYFKTKWPTVKSFGIDTFISQSHCIFYFASFVTREFFTPFLKQWICHQTRELFPPFSKQWSMSINSRIFPALFKTMKHVFKLASFSRPFPINETCLQTRGWKAAHLPNFCRTHLFVIHSMQKIWHFKILNE